MAAPLNLLEFGLGIVSGLWIVGALIKRGLDEPNDHDWPIVEPLLSSSSTAFGASTRVRFRLTR